VRQRPASFLISNSIVRVLGHYGSDTRDLQGAVGDIDEEQNVVCHQSPDRADLDGEKICRHQAFPMSSKERRPRHVLIALRGRIDAVFSENVGDGAARNLMSQIGHCSLDPCVPPRSILKCHTQNEIDDRLHDARSTGASTMAVVPFTCDHFSVPSQEGIRCDQGMKCVQGLTSKRVRFSGESTALGIGETNAPPTQALLKHAVLFLEILDRVQLMAVDPPGEYREQQLKRLKRWGHCSEVYRLTNHRASSSGRLAHSPIASFEFLDTTG
jgi:hypothetical protein